MRECERGEPYRAIGEIRFRWRRNNSESGIITEAEAGK